MCLLRCLVVEHHKRFLELYPACGKPKLHYLLHIPGCIDRFRVVLSCFCPERKHKRSKQIGCCAFRAFCDTLTRRILRQQLAALRESKTFSPLRLDPPGTALTKVLKAKVIEAGLFPFDGGEAAPAGGEAVPAAVESVGLHTAFGHMHRKDLLCAVVGDQKFVGFAQRFFQRLCPGGDEIWALLTVLRPLEGHTFSIRPEHVAERFVRASSLVLALPYLSTGGAIWASFPSDF